VCSYDDKGGIRHLRTNIENINYNDKNDIINIIDPKTYLEKNINPLHHTIDKWFVNYSGMEIPIEVSKLLQMGGKFCLPVNDDKKSAIFEFIKDLEGNSNKHIAGYLDSIRNSVLPPLKEFISHNKQLRGSYTDGNYRQ